MAATDAARHQLYNRLAEVLGPESAEALMSHLPPIPTSELATKSDVAPVRDELRQVRDELGAINQRLDAVNQRFDAVNQHFDAVNQRFDAVNQRIDKMFVAQIATLVTVVAAIVAGNAIF